MGTLLGGVVALGFCLGEVQEGLISCPGDVEIHANANLVSGFENWNGLLR